jgi:hypothetical protein
MNVFDIKIKGDLNDSSTHLYSYIFHSLLGEGVRYNIAYWQM